MKKILLVLSVVLCMVSLVACSKTPDTSGSDIATTTTLNSETATTTTMNTTNVATATIQTPYCNLYVPASFEGAVTSEVASENPYTVKFKAAADNTELFSVVFGGETDNLLGTLQLADKNVVLYATFATLDSADKNYVTYCGYQDGINTIIEHLIADGNFVVNEIVTN